MKGAQGHWPGSERVAEPRDVLRAKTRQRFGVCVAICLPVIGGAARAVLMRQVQPEAQMRPERGRVLVQMFEADKGATVFPAIGAAHVASIGRGTQRSGSMRVVQESAEIELFRKGHRGMIEALPA